MQVGDETALSLSRFKLAFFPKVRGVDVLRESLGRCGAGPRCIIGREPVMLSGYAGDEVMVDIIVESS